MRIKNTATILYCCFAITGIGHAQDLIVSNQKDTFECTILGSPEDEKAPEFLQFEKPNNAGKGRIPMQMVLDFRKDGIWHGNGTIKLSDVFEEPSERLLKSIVLESPGSSAKSLKMKFKNWAQSRFVNLEEVLVGETDSQLTINYIEEYSYRAGLGMSVSISHYVRMICQFKEGKLRVLLFDDGNCFVPSSQYTPSVSARSYYMDSFFNKDGLVVKEYTRVQYRRMLAFNNEINNMLNSVKDILKADADGVLNEDW